jgi:RNA polymerase sigma-70 factor, ECF subfamily
MSNDPTCEQSPTPVQRLFVAHVPALHAWLLSVVPDATLADDLVQETFLTVMQKSADYREGTNFRAWIFAIARFKILEASRQRARYASTLEPDAMDLLLAEHPEPFESHDRRLSTLEKCVGKLKGRAREIIDLRYLEELGPPEIAQRLSWSLNSVNVALTRARQVLRDCVKTNLAQPAPE